MNPTDYAEEVTFLRSLGTSEARIAEQLNVKPGTVAKALRRAGERELASPFERLANAARVGRQRDRKKSCPGCGAVCNVKSRTCIACFKGQRRREMAS